MNSQEIFRLIELGEGQCCEFKRTFAEQNEAIRSLCAFTHSKGGIVVFGISDDSNVIGITLGSNSMENFANTIKSSTQPLINTVIEKLNYNGKCIVVASVKEASKAQLFYAFNSPYIRIGKTNQVMSPDEVRNRLFNGFKAENLLPNLNKKELVSLESWNEREKKRIDVYQNNQGLFLVHSWRPSSTKGQIADIIISLWQHGNGPLSHGTIKSVEYHLGSKFFDHTVVKTNQANNFRIEVSAYGPMLCLAKVNFDDGTPSLDLDRYINFD